MDLSRGEDGVEFILNGSFYEVTYFDLNISKCPFVNDDNTPLRINPGQWFFLKYTVKHKYKNQMYFVELSIYSASNPSYLFYAGSLDTRLCPADNSVTTSNKAKSQELQSFWHRCPELRFLRELREVS